MSTASETVDSVAINAWGVDLAGDLHVPSNATGLILFAHGSGSGRFSSRNRFVADELIKGGMGTLLIDLLTQSEEAIDSRTAHLRFDIDLLADRLVGVIDWLGWDSRTSGLPIGLFGASTGGGAALLATTLRAGRVAAVVSRGGRPDLAGSSLKRVRTPTLLIVGGDDEVVIQLNRQAQVELRMADTKMVIVPGASHLFEEPGKLKEVAQLAADWFVHHFSAQYPASVQ